MVNFNIVDGDSHYLDDIYSDFKSDFINPKMTVAKLRDKYDLSLSNYRQLRKKVLHETGLKIKPYIPYNHDNIIINELTFIRRTSVGNYSICKTVNGKKVNFGTYSTLKLAQKVRSELLKCNWDENRAYDLKMKYAVISPKPIREEAYEKLDEFEELFIKGYTAKQLEEELGINKYQYELLSREVRGKYNVKNKFELFKLNKEKNRMRKYFL